jgi:GTP-binding protein EngB required for normal cell division
MLNDSQPVSMATAYNQEQIKVYLAQQDLKSIEGKPVVVVLGVTGAGKSTTISRLLGGKFKYVNNKLKLTESKIATARIGDTDRSETLHVSLFMDEKNQIVYLDTPGFGETGRGNTAALWVDNTLNLILDLAGSIDAVMVVIDYQSMRTARAQAFKELIKSLSVFLNGSQFFYDSMFFVMNRSMIYNHSKGKMEQVSVSDIIAQAESLQSISKDELDELTKPFKNILGKIDKEIPGEIIKKIEDCDNLIRLLTQMIGHPEKIVFMNPTDKGESNKNILETIKTCPIISKQKLKGVMESKPKNDLLFYDVLSVTVNQYLESLHKKSALLGVALKTLEAKKSTFKLIDEGWQKVKDFYIKKKKDKLLVEQQNINSDQQTIQQLQASTKLVTYHEIQTSRVRTSSFWSWKCFGGGWGIETVNYAGLPFYSAKITAPKATKKVLLSEPKQGKFRASFRSDNGENLQARTEIIMLEKNLPATKARVTVLQSRIKAAQVRVDDLNEEILGLDLSKDPTSLKRAISREISDLYSKLKESSENLKTSFSKNKNIFHQHVINGLESVLSINEKSGYNKSLSSSHLTTFSEFLLYCREIRKAEKESLLIESMPEVRSVCRLKKVEIKKVAPIKKQSYFFQRQKVGSKLENIKSTAKEHLDKHQLEYASAVLVVGLALYFDYSSIKSASRCVGLLCLSTGAFGAIAASRKIFTKATEKIVTHLVGEHDTFLKTIRSSVDSLTEDMSKTSLSASQAISALSKTIEEAATKFKVNVEVKDNVVKAGVFSF